MDGLIDFLKSEAGVTITVAVVGVIYSVIRGTEWYQNLQASRYGTALDAIEAAVSETYNVVVRPAKQTGKWDDDAKQVARRRAETRAREIAQEQGVQIDRLMTPEVLRGEMEKTVWARKSAGRAAKKGAA